MPFMTSTSHPCMNRHAFIRIGSIPLLTLIVLAPSAQVFARVQSTAYKTSDGSSLRQIGQASLIYSVDHQDQLPIATDVWDYARKLAEGAGLDNAYIWTSRIDPAYAGVGSHTPVLVPDTKSPRPLSSDFKNIKPAVAVVLGKLNISMPATTPIAWTRGLQADGTWAKHSPYGTDGGYIVFVGGNVMFYKNLTLDGGELLRFDGKGKTANILEALPPGCRIGEYTPTAEERASWRGPLIPLSDKIGNYSPLIMLILVWAPFLGISIYRIKKQQAGSISIFLWPMILTVLAAIIVPGC
jgi:hypothetical protein